MCLCLQLELNSVLIYNGQSSEYWLMAFDMYFNFGVEVSLALLLESNFVSYFDAQLFYAALELFGLCGAV